MQKYYLSVLGLLFAVTRLVSQPNITSDLTNQVVLANSTNTAFKVQVSGNGPFGYQWIFDGTNESDDIITTLVGKFVTPSSYYGNGVAATNAQLYNPNAMTIDRFGNIFIADTYNNRIRKVDTNGIIFTIAGTNSLPGRPGTYSGDGGPATNAGLSLPSGVAVDDSGNVFFADTGNARIREVNTNGIIVTFAGNGTNGFNGDGGPATNSEIRGLGSYPYGLCFDKLGNLFIADNGNARIRKIDTNGIISTIAGNAGFGYYGNGISATNASLSIPEGMTIDSYGNIFISDSGRVRKVDTNGVITTVAGGGSSLLDGVPAINEQISPYGLCVDASGNLFIGDITNGRRSVHKVDTNGILTTVVGPGGSQQLGVVMGDGGFATNASLGCPYNLLFDAQSNLLILDELYGVVRKVWYAGYPALPLGRLSPLSSGNYQVVVTGSSGSVTSSVAVLSIVYPSISETFVNPNDGSLTIAWPAFQPSIFQVQWTPDLVNGTWANLGNPIAYSSTSSGIASFSDLTWTNYDQGFYRVVWLQ